MKLAGALWILVFLVWIPFEDTAIWFTLALAGASCLWLALRLEAFTAAKPITLALRGAVLGASIPLAACALMAFKSGLHGHGFPDFTIRQIWLLVQISPLLILTGIVYGYLSNPRRSSNRS